MDSDKINVQLWHLLDNSTEIDDYRIEFTTHEKYICTNHTTKRHNMSNSKLNLTCSYCQSNFDYEVKSIKNQRRDEIKLRMIRLFIIIAFELILFLILIENYENLFFSNELLLTNMKVQIMIFILIVFLFPNFIISNFILIVLQFIFPFFDKFSKPVNYSRKGLPSNHKFIFSYGYP